MKAVALTSLGIEDTAAKELKVLGATAIKQQKGYVEFQVKAFKDLAKITYLSRASDKILYHLCQLTFKDIIKDLEKPPECKDLDLFFQKDTTFGAECIKRTPQEQRSEEIETYLGGVVRNNARKQLGFPPKVDLSQPDVNIVGYIVENTCIIGVDCTGIDAQKRDYKIFPTPSSIRGTMGHALLDYAGYTGKELLLDPFVNDGTLIIEAALQATNKSVNFYRKNKLAILDLLPLKNENISLEKFDKIKTTPLQLFGFDAAFKYVDCCRKNAKIAGVEKLFTLSKANADWLDVKFKEATVDIIATKLPEASKRISDDPIKKLHNELFYQAEFILKKNGIIAYLVRKPGTFEQYYKRYKFKQVKQKQVWMGEQPLYMVVLQKQ